MQLACQSLPLLEYGPALGLLIQPCVLEGAPDLLGECHRELPVPLRVITGLRMDDSKRSDDCSSCDDGQP